MKWLKKKLLVCWCCMKSLKFWCEKLISTCCEEPRAITQQSLNLSSHNSHAQRPRMNDIIFHIIVQLWKDISCFAGVDRRKEKNVLILDKKNYEKVKGETNWWMNFIIFQIFPWGVNWMNNNRQARESELRYELLGGENDKREGWKTRQWITSDYDTTAASSCSL